MRHLDVGPAGFVLDEPGISVILLSKTDPDSLVRFRAAVRNLVPSQRLFTLIDSLDRKTLDQAGWVTVTHLAGGGSSLKLIAKEDGALARFIDEAGEGLAARQLRWSALVFGTENDVATIRAAVARFEEDLPEAGETYPKPIMAITKEPEPRMILEVPRADVEALNLAPALLALDTFVLDEQMLNRVSAGIEISFSGYDADKRFLGEIPEVDLYLRHLVLFAPWTPVVATPSTFLLWCKPLEPMCTIETCPDETTRVHIPPGGGNAMLEKLAYAVAEMTAERLMMRDLHPRLRRAIETWQQYLAGVAPDAIEQDEAIEQTLRAQAAATAPARNEKEFWESIATTHAPGWVVNLQTDDHSQIQQGLAGKSATIYVLDTKTGWIAAGGLLLDQAQQLITTVQGNPEAMSGAPSVAIDTIRRQGDKQAAGDEPQTRLAITAAVAAFASTKLLQAVIDTTGSIAGHYLYMVYSPVNGEPFGRPVYLTSDVQNSIVAPLEAIFQGAAEAIRQDMTNTSGFVGGKIRANGGLALADVIQDLVGDVK